MRNWSNGDDVIDKWTLAQAIRDLQDGNGELHLDAPTVYRLIKKAEIDRNYICAIQTKTVELQRLLDQQSRDLKTFSKPVETAPKAEGP